MSDVAERLASALSDRYTIERELAGGGMSVVYLATDLRHERRVAIKVLRPELTSMVAAERFLREVKLTANLAHPHILPLLDSGVADGPLYYVMPYVEGESLRGRLEREGRLPVDEAVRITREVADALSYAHERNLLHRDIKPENILLEAGHAVVADFGIHKALSKAAGERLTETGVTIGTPAYMSPEQAAGEQELSEASDLYSLACVLYEMLAGEPPVMDPSVQTVVSRKLLGEFRPLREVCPEVTREVEHAVTRALATDPGDRFPTVGDFVAALQQPVPESGGQPIAWAWTSPLRRAALAVGAATIMAGAAYVTLPRLLSKRTPAPTLAVLPCENISPDAEAVEWFVSGVREDVSERLTEVSALTVRPPETVRTVYENSDRDLGEIASKLQATALLTCAVRVVGNRFRLTARLIDVAGDTTLWQSSYDGDYTIGSEMFGTQRDVAQRIASALGTAPSRDERTLMGKVPTQNLRAWNLYRQGRFLENRWTSEALHRAIDLYNQAIAEDPEFTEPYAGLASATLNLWQVEMGLSFDSAQRVISAVERALAIDSTLGDAYRIRGEVKHVTWDFFGAERDFQTALRLDPNNALAHMGYAQFLNTVGRNEEALSHALRAEEINPVDPFIAANVGARYGALGRYDEALAEDRRALELDPQHWVVHWDIADNYEMMGRYDEAIAEFKRTAELSDGVVDTLSSLGMLYARAGRRAEAEAMLSQLAERTPPPLMRLAAIHAMLGERDLAFQELEQAYLAHLPGLPGYLISPWDSLRSDSRLEMLRQKTGLSAYLAAQTGS